MKLGGGAIFVFERPVLLTEPHIPARMTEAIAYPSSVLSNCLTNSWDLAR
jgi:hypothetical protein